MNNRLIFGLTYGSAIGCGLMSGLFFTFSVFMMRALDRLPAPQGIAAMQSTNKTIQTPLFFLAFMGTTISCLVLAGLAVVKLDGPTRTWVIAGCALYLVGAFLMTVGYHVPRNEHLDTLNPDTAEAARYWTGFVKNWTLWNHVRTVASLGAMSSLIMAIRIGS
ncbi:MAG TPA: anthrone oxygenase family protein [Acidimicrobiales bacterium]|jgi:uncharacterized membrane protein